MPPPVESAVICPPDGTWNTILIKVFPVPRCAVLSPPHPGTAALHTPFPLISRTIPQTTPESCDTGAAFFRCANIAPRKATHFARCHARRGRDCKVNPERRPLFVREDRKVMGRRQILAVFHAARPPHKEAVRRRLEKYSNRSTGGSVRVYIWFNMGCGQTDSTRQLSTPDDVLVKLDRFIALPVLLENNPSTTGEVHATASSLIAL
ncbi:hypothetical protein Bbelb_359000 [Branchiostoma belcheri]|nr:hypothetical protein Bbelb_359000 [Branchiostoma belcheri]